MEPVPDTAVSLRVPLRYRRRRMAYDYDVAVGYD